MEKRLMDQFVLAESQEELDRVDHLFEASWQTRDKKVKSALLLEMRSIMKFSAFVGFHETYKAIELWRILSRRKVMIQNRGITIGTRVRNSMRKIQSDGVVVGIRGDFVLKVKGDDGSQMTMTPKDVELIS